MAEIREVGKGHSSYEGADRQGSIAIQRGNMFKYLSTTAEGGNPQEEGQLGWRYDRRGRELGATRSKEEGSEASGMRVVALQARGVGCGAGRTVR